MRKKVPYKPHFSCIYEELIDKSVEKEAYLRRDLGDLSTQGITEAEIDAMAALRVAFVALPAENAGTVTATKAFNARNKTVASLVAAIRGVASIALATFGKKSTQYKWFTIKKLSKLSPSYLYAKAPTVVIGGNKYFAEMEINGLTAAMLTNITTLTNNLMVLVGNTGTAVGNSFGITGNRRAAADSLYDSMNGMYQTAASYYQNSNKLKAANYTLYGKEGKAVVRRGIVKATKTSFPKTKGIKASTVFRLKTTTGKSVQYYFGMLKRSAPTASALTVKLNKKVFATTTAAKLGYSKAGGIIVLNILNDNDDAAGFVMMMGGKA
jgi:hypothetical protein